MNIQLLHVQITEHHAGHGLQIDVPGFRLCAIRLKFQLRRWGRHSMAAIDYGSGPEGFLYKLSSSHTAHVVYTPLFELRLEDWR